MKQCLRCKKVVPEHAKICPHCGYRLEGNYKPMKKRKHSIAVIYIVLACAFLFSPIVLSALLGTTLTESTAPIMNQGSITLGKLGNVKELQETIEYEFTNLDTFDKAIQGKTPLLKSIRSFEKELTEITNHKIDKEYIIYVTDLNNIYYNLQYTIPINENDTIEVTMFFDIEKYTNQVQVKYYQRNRETFADMKYNANTYTDVKKVITLITGDKKVSLIDKVGKDFNKKGSEFEQRKKILGHYGVGSNIVKDPDSCSIYVYGPFNDYTVRCEYQTKVNTKKFS